MNRLNYFSSDMSGGTSSEFYLSKQTAMLFSSRAGLLKLNGVEMMSREASNLNLNLI